MGKQPFRRILSIGILAVGLSAGAAGNGPAEGAEGRWMAGDFHTHTHLSDGGKTLEEVARHAFANGLDWFANTDHGGYSRRDLDGNPFPEPVPRWITLARDSFPAVQRLREAFPGKEILLGFEWNVPGHEHASVGFAADEPDSASDFEYMCDAADDDAGRDLPKWNKTRADALACAAYLERSHGRTGYFLVNHPSRRLLWSIADLREFNDAAPNTAFGFEGIPGHQKNAARGGYKFISPDRSDNDRSRTHGGVDYMAAKVGGAWDALLGEGRRFFLFANSDFHDNVHGFWPGEYARSYTFVKGTGPQAVIDGMRSGNSFSVTGNLIDALSFTASARDHTAAMGETLRIEPDERVEISIAFHSPENHYGRVVPRVDHIDLISGRIKAKAKPGTSPYRKDVNPTARVASRISPGEWTCEAGSCRARVDVGPVRHSMYFRIRGTNLPPSTPRETDREGNPLSDDAACGKGEDPPKCNTAEKARADLWFYSNPIFIEVPAGI